MCQDIFQLNKLLTENEVYVANYEFPNKDIIIKRLGIKYPQAEHFIFSDFVQIEGMKYRINEITVSLILKYKTLIITEDGTTIFEEVHDMMPIIVKNVHVVQYLNLLSIESVRKMMNDSFYKTKQNQNNAMVEYFIDIDEKNLLLDCIKMKNINHCDMHKMWKKLASEKLDLIKEISTAPVCEIFNPYENKLRTFTLKQQPYNNFIDTKKIFENINKIDYWIARINYTFFLGDKTEFLKHSLNS